MGQPAGRRERKKLHTHLAIKAAALHLFAERGYRESTINDIAEAADVAPRTVTLHFATKEELLFDAEPFALDSMRDRLAARKTGETTLDALRDWMAATMTALESASPDSNERFWEQRALRARIITAEPELRGRARAGYYEFERVLADAIGEDIDQSGNALIPRLAALSAVIGLREVYESDEARALGGDPRAADLLALVDRVIAFGRSGLSGSDYVSIE